jgi:uncharacterized protein (DUF1697 family)
VNRYRKREAAPAAAVNAYVILLRGVNVGGKNKVPMAELKTCLEKLGFTDVSTYIASGNILLKSDKEPRRIETEIEYALLKNFTLDSKIVRVLAVSRDQLQSIVAHKPKGFGEHPEMYHSDVIFLMGIHIDQAMPVFVPRDGVDKIWPGEDVVYSQRVSALRTKSRLNRIIGTLPYKSMTIRSWNTTVKLLELLEK